MPQGEWVELYNSSIYPHEVDGWYLWDASNGLGNKVPITAANTMPATTTIPALGYLVVYMNKPVLDNGGDTVKLFDSTDALVDEYEYKGHDYCEIEPTPGEGNSEASSGVNCQLIPPNKSYARIPDGVGAWVDPVPTPGYPNTPNEFIGERFLDAHEAMLEHLEPAPTSTPPAVPIIEEVALATTSDAVSSTTMPIDGYAIELVPEESSDEAVVSTSTPDNMSANTEDILTGDTASSTPEGETPAEEESTAPLEDTPEEIQTEDVARREDTAKPEEDSREDQAEAPAIPEEMTAGASEVPDNEMP